MLPYSICIYVSAIESPLRPESNTVFNTVLKMSNLTGHKKYINIIFHLIYFIEKHNSYNINGEKSQPFGAFFEHCSHDYAKLPHFHAGHKVAALLDVDSVEAELCMLLMCYRSINCS